MNLKMILIIVHVIISFALVVVVLMQHGKQQGLSGAIAGGAETFFGKNKGKTIDAMLKKFTAVVAVLFVLSSIALTYVSIQDTKKAAAEAEAAATQSVEQQAEQPAMPTQNENGDFVDEQGNVVMTKEDYEKAIAEQAAQAPAQGETSTQTQGQAQTTESTPAQ